MAKATGTKRRTAKKTTADTAVAPAAVAPNGGRDARPTVLTGRKTGKTVNALLLPYQRAWVNDESPRKLGDKSRRIGWTWAEAFDAVSRRWRAQDRRECDLWFSSADESAAAEFIDYCRWFAAAVFGGVADRYTESIEDEQTRRVATAYVVRTPSGHKIVGMTSNPRRFRSKGGDVVLDEFGFHEQARDMYTAAAPVTTWGGSLRVFSTPNGEGSQFNKLVQRCRELLRRMNRDPDQGSRGVSWEALVSAARTWQLTPVFSYHRVTIEDAIADGLVETINRTRGTSWTREAFLADCREKCLDEESFRQEYLCEPGADAAAWLSYTLIESCEDQQVPPPVTGETPTTIETAGGPVYVGVDVGRHRDLTVIWVLEKLGDVLWTREIRYVEKMSLPQQEQLLIGILNQLPKLAACEIDCTGIGLGLYEHVKRRLGSRVHGVQFGSSVGVDKATRAPVTEVMATTLKKVMSDRQLRLPWNASRVKEGLHKPRVEYAASGRMRFHAARDAAGHADEFWALALAVASATTRKSAGMVRF